MRISIIICTRNRAYALPKCLDAAFESIRQVGLTNDCQLVLVDNGSTDDTGMVIKSWSSANTIDVSYVHEPVAGLSVARNSGARAARGDLIVFTDDDCCLSPTYLSELLAYDEEDGRQLVMRSGSVGLGDSNDLPLTVKYVLTRRRWVRPATLVDEADIMGGSLIGCNIAMRREVISLIGGFDTKLGAGTTCPAGEDTDYFYRAYLKGITLDLVPDMHVRHFHGRRSLEDRTNLLKNYAVGNGALAIKYLFIYPRFSKHLVWAARDAINVFIKPERAAGHWIDPRVNLNFMLKGAFRYILSGLS